MSKNKVKKMVEIKKLFIMFFAFVMITSCCSAFCFVQGYVKNKQGSRAAAEIVNIVCKTSSGEKVIQDSGDGYGYPFGGLETDCSFCSEGIYVNAVDNNNNLYGEIEDTSCNVEGSTYCQNDIIISSLEASEDENGIEDSNGELSSVPYYDYTAPAENDANRQAPSDFNPSNLPGVPNPEREEVVKNTFFIAFLILIAVLIFFIKMRGKDK